MSSKTERGFLPRMRGIRNALRVPGVPDYGLMTQPDVPTFPLPDSLSRSRRWSRRARNGTALASAGDTASTIENMPAMQEASPDLHPLQQLVIEADFARSFFIEGNKNYKKEHESIMQRNPGEVKKDLKRRHVEGLVAAYYATRPGENETERMEQFHSTWEGQSDYLLEQLQSFLPGLEARRAEALAEATSIEPYDVKLAKRRAQRTRIGLPRAQRALFDGMSGVDPKSHTKQVAEVATSILTAVGSFVAVDAVAGAVATPIERAHFPLLETADMRIVIPAALATYIPLVHGVLKHIGANGRLTKETGLQTNVGYAAGDKVTQVIGLDENASEKVSQWSQGGLELIKDPIWIGTLIGLVASHHMTPRDALILGAFANLGGAGYEYGVAGAVHKALDVRRNWYNKRNPFPVVGEVSVLEQGDPELLADPVADIPFVGSSLPAAVPAPATVLFSAAPTARVNQKI